MNRRTLLAVAAFALSIAIVAGSGSFTSASADRPVSVNVVADDRAFVGIETESHELTNGNHRVVVATITNRFDTRLNHASVTVPGEPSGPPPVIGDVESPSTIDSGGEIDVRASVRCGNATSGASIPLRIEAWSENVHVEMTRSVTISCTGTVPGNESDEANETNSSADDPPDESGSDDSSGTP
ncbi:MAG: hypothetical protein ACOC0F_00790 [archaeon]